MLVDSHCHLNFPSLTGNLPEVLARANKAGLELMQTICTKLSEFEEIKKIADEHKDVFCSVGVHPQNVKEEGVVEVAHLVKLTLGNKVIGIGETGLDYYRSDEVKELQKQSFINHIKAAQLTGLPVIIHSRNADEDMLQILKDQMARKKFKAVLHCFTGSKAFADSALELGIYISASGIVTFKNAKPLQEVFKNVPLNRLLIETDAPYLAPGPLRGRTNEPAFIKHIAQFLVRLLGISFDDLARYTTQNFFELFSKAPSQFKNNKLYNV
jgi:TatD DNase family protein